MTLFYKRLYICFMIKIEKKVPVPTKGKGRKSIYPFESMSVGDSFEFNALDRSSVSSSANQWVKRKANGFKFTVSVTGNKGRIWRVS